MIASRIVAIQDILFATDLSPQAEPAFQTALALAQHFGAKLHLLHVVAFPSLRKGGQAKLKAFVEANAVEGAEFVMTVAVGMASSEIVSYAEREKVDLIVMGTHGRTGFAHVLIGSVAEAVVRTAPCQVLTVRYPKEAQAKAPQPVQADRRAPVTQQHCMVCAQPSQELVCEPCKAKIRGEALERKSQDEKAGRKGL
jgi:nucleotide-binding universal stress UspA family protein